MCSLDFLSQQANLKEKIRKHQIEAVDLQKQYDLLIGDSYENKLYQIKLEEYKKDPYHCWTFHDAKLRNKRLLDDLKEQEIRLDVLLRNNDGKLRELKNIYLTSAKEELQRSTTQTAISATLQSNEQNKKYFEPSETSHQKNYDALSSHRSTNIKLPNPPENIREEAINQSKLRMEANTPDKRILNEPIILMEKSIDSTYQQQMSLQMESGTNSITKSNKPIENPNIIEPIKIPTLNQLDVTSEEDDSVTEITNELNPTVKLQPKSDSITPQITPRMKDNRESSRHEAEDGEDGDYSLRITPRMIDHRHREMVRKSQELISKSDESSDHVYMNEPNTSLKAGTYLKIWNAISKRIDNDDFGAILLHSSRECDTGQITTSRMTEIKPELMRLAEGNPIGKWSREKNEEMMCCMLTWMTELAVDLEFEIADIIENKELMAKIDRESYDLTKTKALIRSSVNWPEAKSQFLDSIFVGLEKLKSDSDSSIKSKCADALSPLLMHYSGSVNTEEKVSKFLLNLIQPNKKTEPILNTNDDDHEEDSLSSGVSDNLPNKKSTDSSIRQQSQKRIKEKDLERMKSNLSKSLPFQTIKFEVSENDDSEEDLDDMFAQKLKLGSSLDNQSVNKQIKNQNDIDQSKPKHKNEIKAKLASSIMNIDDDLLMNDKMNSKSTINKEPDDFDNIEF